jgi:monothiol glutaredoxin
MIAILRELKRCQLLLEIGSLPEAEEEELGPFVDQLHEAFSDLSAVYESRRSEHQDLISPAALRARIAAEPTPRSLTFVRAPRNAHSPPEFQESGPNPAAPRFLIKCAVIHSFFTEAAMSDVQTWIKETVSSTPVVLFMKGTAQFPQCGFSGRAIQILKACGVENIATVNVLDDPEVRQGIKDFSNWPTVPQLYVKGEFIGGTDIMNEMFESGELKALLDA